MLDPKLLRNEPEKAAKQLRQRGFELDVQQLKALEQERKQAQAEAQSLQTERNRRSKMIGKAKAAGDDIKPLLAEIDDLGAKHKQAESRLAEVLDKINVFALNVPNLSQDDVPQGQTEDDNQEILKWGDLPQFDFEAKDHVDLGENLGMDFETAAKMSN